MLISKDNIRKCTELKKFFLERLAQSICLHFIIADRFYIVWCKIVYLLLKSSSLRSSHISFISFLIYINAFQYSSIPQHLLHHRCLKISNIHPYMTVLTLTKFDKFSIWHIIKPYKSFFKKQLTEIVNEDYTVPSRKVFIYSCSSLLSKTSLIPVKGKVMNRIYARQSLVQGKK